MHSLPSSSALLLHACPLPFYGAPPAPTSKRTPVASTSPPRQSVSTKVQKIRIGKISQETTSGSRFPSHRAQISKDYLVYRVSMHSIGLCLCLLLRTRTRRLPVFQYNEDMKRVEALTTVPRLFPALPRPSIRIVLKQSGATAVVPKLTALIVGRKVLLEQACYCSHVPEMKGRSRNVIESRGS